jgi:hypothetical protein
MGLRTPEIWWGEAPEWFYGLLEGAGLRRPKHSGYTNTLAEPRSIVRKGEAHH